MHLQRTSPTMAGVVVRGLTGNKVTVLVDGVRYSNGAQRGGWRPGRMPSWWTSRTSATATTAASRGGWTRPDAASRCATSRGSDPSIHAGGSRRRSRGSRRRRSERPSSTGTPLAVTGRATSGRQRRSGAGRPQGGPTGPAPAPHASRSSRARRGGPTACPRSEAGTRPACDRGATRRQRGATAPETPGRASTGFPATDELISRLTFRRQRCCSRSPGSARRSRSARPGPGTSSG